jgi:hypothetical protein
LEVATRPVTSWDAKQHWTKQARVFYEHLRVVPYVSLQDWLDLGGRGVYTNMHPGYPITAPLLQAWIAVAIGAWHESLVNLPWLAVWVAMGMVFYSQARIAGGSIGLAIGATYMVLSMPYMNIHVALAGYADLFMAASYLGAVASLYNWSRTRASWLLYLGLITGASCMLFKNEGFYWFMSLIPGILLVLLGVRRGLLVLASMLLLLLLFVALMPVETVVAGHSLAGLDIRYRPESWFPLYLSFFCTRQQAFSGVSGLAGYGSSAVVCPRGIAACCCGDVSLAAVSGTLSVYQQCDGCRIFYLPEQSWPAYNAGSGFFGICCTDAATPTGF